MPIRPAYRTTPRNQRRPGARALAAAAAACTAVFGAALPACAAPPTPFAAPAAATPPSTPSATPLLRYLGQQIVPTGTLFEGTQVGGLSGIDRDEATGRYTAISDDRSQFNPARFYELSLDLSQFTRSNTPGAAGVSFNTVTTLAAPDGAPYAAFSVDPESLQLRKSGGVTTILWTNEGQRATTGLQNPTLREATAEGAYVRDFAVPALFNPTGSATGTEPGDTGIRNNLAFESLALSRDGRTVWTATENALVPDGPAAALGVGSVSRLAAFDVRTGAAGTQYAYPVEPVVDAPIPEGSFATNGLVELLVLAPRYGSACFIAMERSFSTGVGNRIRLYLADGSAATDVRNVPALAGAAYTPMRKQLLLDLDTLRNDDGSAVLLDNVEGIALGPVVDGRQTVILVSDNNFSATQFTQFIALDVPQGGLARGCGGRQ